MELGGEIVSGLKTGRAQDRVTLTFPRPDSFDRLGEHLRTVMEAAEAARQRARALQAIPPPIEQQ